MFSSEILEVYKKCDIRTFPIDCEKIIECHNYRIRSYAEVLSQLPEACQLAKAFSDDSFADKENRLILYNNKVSKYRVRFSQMHELGHIVLGHIGKCQEYEDEADIFASNILAPRVAIKYYDCKTADDIHDIFCMSYAASNRAIMDYNKWKLEDISDEDYELNLWIHFPVCYQHRERFFRNKKKRLKKIKRENRYCEERRNLIEENLGNYNDYIWSEHERQLTCI